MSLPKHFARSVYLVIKYSTEHNSWLLIEFSVIDSGSEVQRVFSFNCHFHFKIRFIPSAVTGQINIFSVKRSSNCDSTHGIPRRKSFGLGAVNWIFLYFFFLVTDLWFLDMRHQNASNVIFTSTRQMSQGDRTIISTQPWRLVSWSVAVFFACCKRIIIQVATRR